MVSQMDLTNRIDIATFDLTCIKDDMSYVIIPDVVQPQRLDSAFINRQIGVVKRHGRVIFQSENTSMAGEEFSMR